MAGHGLRYYRWARDTFRRGELCRPGLLGEMGNTASISRRNDVGADTLEDEVWVFGFPGSNFHAR